MSFLNCKNVDQININLYPIIIPIPFDHSQQFQNFLTSLHQNQNLHHRCKLQTYPLPAQTFKAPSAASPPFKKHPARNCATMLITVYISRPLAGSLIHSAHSFPLFHSRAAFGDTRGPPARPPASICSSRRRRANATHIPRAGRSIPARAGVGATWRTAAFTSGSGAAPVLGSGGA